jgi:hypothetical protein
MNESTADEIRDVCAHYGLAMYQAQCLERELAIVLACIYAPVHSHRWAYEERLGENFTLRFGTLANRFLEAATAEHLDLAQRVQSVVELRNEIAHRYFWNRAVELTRSDGRQAIIHELMDAGNGFDALDHELTHLTMAWSTDKGLSPTDREAALADLLSGRTPPRDIGQKKLPKQVQLTEIYRWHGDPERPTRFAPLLRTGDGLNLLLSNRGLSSGPPTVNEQELVLMTEMNKALPAIVNPLPKNATDWNYTISLGNGFELWVEPHHDRVYRWGIRPKRGL